MSLEGDVTARPPRISMGNLRTGEIVEMPLFPESFNEEISVSWSKLQILGMSHEPKQYSNTGNYRIPGLILPFQSLDAEVIDRYHDIRNFLMSLTVPPEGASDIRSGGADRIMFFWPQMISMTCNIESLRFSHERFNRFGRSTSFRATIDLEEIRDVRLTSEDVRVSGTRRPTRVYSEDV